MTNVTKSNIPVQSQSVQTGENITKSNTPVQSQSTQTATNVDTGTNGKVLAVKTNPVVGARLRIGSINIPPVKPQVNCIKMHALSPYNDTPVFTSARLNQRGTSEPLEAYNSATIFAEDEIYVEVMNDNFALVSYPVDSGRSRKKGYVNTSSLTLNNFSRGKLKSRNANNGFTTYIRPGGQAYGSIDNGDDVWTLARVDNYTQVVYPVEKGSNYGIR